MTRERQNNIIMAAEAIGLIRDCMKFRNRGFEKDLADLNQRLAAAKAPVDMEKAHARVRVFPGAGTVMPRE